MTTPRFRTAIAGFALGCFIVVPLSAQRTSDPPQPQGRSVERVLGDGWITMKVHSLFVPEDVLDGSDIDVDTNNGVVTLSGTVPSAAAKARAVAIAKAADGVKRVTDLLRVGPARTTTTGAAREAGRDTAASAKKAGRAVNDGWIKSKIYAQFLGEDALDDSNIDIDVVSGAVTLKGTVRSESGRARALALARGTEGVNTVKDSLKVGPGTR